MLDITTLLGQGVISLVVTGGARLYESKRSADLKADQVNLADLQKRLEAARLEHAQLRREVDELKAQREADRETYRLESLKSTLRIEELTRSCAASDQRAAREAARADNLDEIRGALELSLKRALSDQDSLRDQVEQLREQLAAAAALRASYEAELEQLRSLITDPTGAAAPQTGATP